MNIGQLMRVVLGDAAPAEPKALELKVGQIVKGLVLQLLSEQDALVNISGTVVRARLETPLRPSQVTLLQVQPESTAGQVLLKPLAASDVPIPEDSAPLLLQSLGLPDRPDTRRAVQSLHQEGAPVSKESIEAFAKVMGTKPAAIPEEQWTGAAVLAAQKGLPLTQETVAALRQTLFGPPLHETASELSAKLGDWLRQNADTPLPVPLVRTARQTVEAISRLRAESAALADSAEAARPSAPPKPAGPAAVAGDAEPSRHAGQAAVSGDGKTMPPAGLFDTERLRQTAANEGEIPADAAAGDGGQETMSPTAGKARQAGAGKPASTGEATARAGQPSDDSRVQEGHGARTAVPETNRIPSQGDIDEQSNANHSEPRPMSGGTMVQTVLKLLGIDHEHNWGRLLAHEGVRHSATPDLLADNAWTSTSAATDQDPVRPNDSLKSLLLQLSAADELPPAIRETAQQLLQQVTGSQLLLVPDRGAPFAHVTLTLPMLQSDGRQTAAIHIQSRAGKRGELDADNCRLLFDLQMKTLGLMLVDVRVVDRMVSLEVRNDFPGVGDWIDGYREEIAAGLGQSGYQLLSLKSMPFPDRKDTSGGAAETPNAAIASPIAARYKEKPYKGMDIRV